MFFYLRCPADVIDVKHARTAQDDYYAWAHSDDILLRYPADVIDVEQARIAEEAGAVAVMALERIPADIRKDGGVARMSDPEMITEIKKAVSIPVMAKVRFFFFLLLRQLHVYVQLIAEVRWPQAFPAWWR